jgi:hypothetical protein
MRDGPSVTRRRLMTFRLLPVLADAVISVAAFRVVSDCRFQADPSSPVRAHANRFESLFSHIWQ